MKRSALVTLAILWAMLAAASGADLSAKVGKVDTPLRAFFTMRMCYALSQPAYCWAVGIKGQKFRDAPVKIGRLDDVDPHGTRVWGADFRVLTGEDIEVLGGERFWARAGDAQIAFLALGCGEEAGDIACDRDYSEVHDHWSLEVAYFRRAGSSWHLVGLTEDPNGPGCYHLDDMFPFDDHRCDFIWSEEDDEAFGRMVKRQGWPWVSQAK